MKRAIFAAILATSVMYGGLAVAQQPAPAAAPDGPRGHGMFGLGDTNKDGVITRDEVKAAAEKRFDALDVDKNGVFDKADRDALRARKVDERFTRMDTDKNGELSRAEFDSAHAAKPGADGGPGHRMGRWGKRGGRGHGGMMGGDISKADFIARPLAMFDRVDTNHDGKITPEEREAARARMQSMHGHRGGPDGDEGGKPASPPQP